MTDHQDSPPDGATSVRSPLARLWDRAKKNPFIASVLFLIPLVAAAFNFGKDAYDFYQKINPPLSVREISKGLAADAIEVRIDSIQQISEATGLSKGEIRTFALALESMVNRRAPAWPNEGDISGPRDDIRLAMIALGKLVQAGHLQNIKMSAPRLSGINLEGIDATDAYWQGFIFQRVNLSGATLLRADLSSSTIQDVKLARIQATNSLLPGSTIESSCAEEAVFLNANLSGIKIARSDLNAADLRNAKVDKSIFHDTRLHKVDFTDADLSGADFSTATEVAPEQLARAKISKHKPIPPQDGWRRSNVAPCN